MMRKVGLYVCAMLTGLQYCSIRLWGDSGSYSDVTTDFVHSYAVTISKGHSGSGTYAYYSGNDQVGMMPFLGV